MTALLDPHSWDDAPPHDDSDYAGDDDDGYRSPRPSLVQAFTEQLEQRSNTDVIEADDPSPIAGVDGEHYTDVGNAERMVASHGTRIGYVSVWGRWKVYDGQRWRDDPADTVVGNLASRIGRDLLRHLPEIISDRKASDALIAHARRSESAAGVAATLAMTTTRRGVAIDHEQLDADPWLLNVRNGTVELRTGTLRPHNPSDLLTMLADVDYDADAEAPGWCAFLAAILPDDEVRSFVQRLLGLALVGAQIEHVLPIGLGVGANGKSTLTGIVAAVFGDYATVASKDVLLALKHSAHPTARADLFRRRFAHSGEIPAGARLDEAQVKELTGGDRIKARRMREDFWDFAPSHMLWLHANHRPAIEGTDEGIWRRVLLIPFDVQIPTDQRDPYLAERILTNERAGVLNWLLDGLADYQAGGLRVPDAVAVATSEYRNSSDTVAAFITEAGLVFDPGLSIGTNDLLALHGEWFAANGPAGPEKLHYQRVVEALKTRGVTAARTGGRGRFWRGVGAPIEQGSDNG